MAFPFPLRELALEGAGCDKSELSDEWFTMSNKGSFGEGIKTHQALLESLRVGPCLPGHFSFSSVSLLIKSLQPQYPGRNSKKNLRQLDQEIRPCWYQSYFPTSLTICDMSLNVNFHETHAWTQTVTWPTMPLWIVREEADWWKVLEGHLEYRVHPLGHSQTYCLWASIVGCRTIDALGNCIRVSSHIT